ncbi:hypothetical protein IW262DRAFT_1455022 [Armillaria fumosa]|nr:hypothetical protein IW262DRAFT_1455022 [Armillaria fumosa]
MVHCSDMFQDSSPEEDDDDPTNIPSTVDPPADSAPPLLDPEDDVLCVMLPEIQEEQLHTHYVALPGLGTVRVMVPIGQDPSSFDQPCYIMIDDVAHLFNKNTICSLIVAQQFTGSGPYCNLSTLGLLSLTCDDPSPALQKKPPATDGGQSSNLTPGKSAWPKSPSKPATLTSHPIPEWEYYHCLGFNNEVPIFDGHASKGSHFLFCSTDFTGMSALS